MMLGMLPFILMCSIFHRYKLILIVIFLLLVSCQRKDIITPSKKMEQIFYTQEGKPYILKSVTKNRPSFTGVFNFTYPELRVNFNTSAGLLPGSTDIDTPKKIIPISASLGIYDLTLGDVAIDITTPFYSVVNGFGTSNGFYGQRAQAKILPLIDRSFFNDLTHFAYSVKYGQSVYCLEDFIPTSDGLLISFNYSQAIGLTNQNPGIISSDPTHTYSSSLVIVYFELLSN
jgi:hypothetical protein